MAKSGFTSHLLDLITQLPFKLYVFLYMTNILLYSYLITSTSTISISPTNKDDYLPSDDPNITNLMVSHYDCEKQHNLRQFNLLNVKQCTEATSNIQHASVKAQVYMSEQRLNALKLTNVSHMPKKENFVFKAQSNFDVEPQHYATSCYPYSFRMQGYY